jgi:signal transduction histidine kinase/CheY-like chemotaxis protein
MRPLLSFNLHHDQDVVAARRHASEIASLLDFDIPDQTRIATAVSEIARNAFRYGGGGWVEFDVSLDSRPQRMVVRVVDTGPGVECLDDVLSGRYQSPTGMGRGIMGARRLMDGFSIDSSPGGTRVVLEKALPARGAAITVDRLREIAEALRHRRPKGLLEEVQQQNQELLNALEEVQRKQQELAHLNRELEDTNRGVVALYAELDERADHLRRADDMKSRFLSNMTHEFRTPVNAIIGLCNLMLDDRRQEGREPEPELGYIVRAADQLSALVNDLLDLAKVAAGKTVVRPAEFDVAQLFGALRGMLRPLLLNQSVALVFEDAADVPPLHTDEAKVSQILRNLISNALKFTERGEVRVAVWMDEPSGTITFTVADTGIGIAPQDQEKIFEEFSQLEHRLQRRVRGTGLGLPLARRLAELLGGTLLVTSEPGVGSTFSVSLPATYVPQERGPAAVEWRSEPGKLPLLLIEDAAEERYFYEKILRNSAFQLYPASSPAEAAVALETIQPAVIVLDLLLGGTAEWDLLIRLKRDERTRAIPVVVVSAVDEREKALALGADGYLVKPIERAALLDTLSGVGGPAPAAVRVLAVDDEESARYIVRQSLPHPAFDVSEAAGGTEGIRRAREELPHVILLDLVMPGISGRETLEKLHDDPATQKIPVIIFTSAELEDREKEELLRRAAAVLLKGNLSRRTLQDVVRAVLGRPL